MNVKIDIDISPEEVRKLFGLPDLEAFQQQLMEDVRKRMAEGGEGYDPIKLFQPYISGTLASWDMFQKAFTAAAQTGTKRREGEKK